MPRRLNDTETMLWNLDQHPSLASTMGSVIDLEAAPDPERMRRTVIAAIGAVPALREQVRPSALPLAGPEWVVDRHLDLDHHLRFVRLAHPASAAALMDAAARIINDPFDRTRPLWQFTVVTGLPRGRAALITKLHHAIADGQGAMALAAHLLDLSGDAPEPEPRTVASVLDDVDEPDDGSAGLVDSLLAGAERLAGLITDTATNLSADDLGRPATETVSTLLSLGDHLPDVGPGSALWAVRSRNRRITSVRTSLAELRARGRELGVSVNDLFVAACTEAAVRQHVRADHAIDHLVTTVVISTRTDDHDAAVNAAVPVPIVVPVDADPVERARVVRDSVQARRDEVNDAPDLLSAIGSLANIVPSSLVAGIARDQARKVDFATSNLPGPPVPVWIAGRRVLGITPVGPVAGTAFNATLMSHLDDISVGLHVDPAAVRVPADLADDLASGFRTLGVGAR